MMVLKHESSGSFKSQQSGLQRECSRSDDESREVSACGTSRPSSRSVTFEENPNVSFFPGSSSDSEDDYVFLVDSDDSPSTDKVDVASSWPQLPLIVSTMSALLVGLLLGRWHRR